MVELLVKLKWIVTQGHGITPLFFKYKNLYGVHNEAVIEVLYFLIFHKFDSIHSHNFNFQFCFTAVQTL